ncbi:hypothetical protein EfmGK941_15400 [Enterococcus faecium]|nr:hypothetical protein EfmGK941_15400 [Enterococcus faecium]
MVLRYPNGQPYYKNAMSLKPPKSISLCLVINGIFWMRFEEAINESNDTSLIYIILWNTGLIL